MEYRHCVCVPPGT